MEKQNHGFMPGETIIPIVGSETRYVLTNIYHRCIYIGDDTFGDGTPIIAVSAQSVGKCRYPDCCIGRIGLRGPFRVEAKYFRKVKEVVIPPMKSLEI